MPGQENYRYTPFEVIELMGEDSIPEIVIISSNKKEYLDLLLVADESEFMIDKYLERGVMFGLFDDGLKSICVVAHESADICELKNIATYETWRGRGYGSMLLQHVCSFYSGRYTTMMVGTGDTPAAIRFYRKNGFAISHRIEGFFTDNYDHPMYESGIQLVDMVYLSRKLND